MNKPILCLDFDGVLHSYTSKWVDVTTIPDPPVPNAVGFCWEAIEHFRVAVYSSRSETISGIEAMKAWMRRHDFPVEHMEFSSTKPPAFLTIDDRAYTFLGFFPHPETLLGFKSWNKLGFLPRGEVGFPVGPAVSLDGKRVFYEVDRHYWQSEEYQCAQQVLNEMGAPTEKDGNQLSLVGRIKWLLESGKDRTCDPS